MADTIKKTVLIIEDDQFLVKAYQFKLTKEGFDVQLATDGDAAMERLKGESPAVVLLDLMLPGASGFDILAALRKSDAWKNVPVLIMTNLAQPSDEQRCRELGVSEYLVKANIGIDEVAAKVKQYLST